MTGERDDEALRGKVADVVRPRPAPPSEVVDGVKREFSWRSIDVELARLTHDSLVDAGPLSTRTADQPRLLTFEIASETRRSAEPTPSVIEMEVEVVPGGRRILGHVVPAAAVDLEVRAGEVGRAEEVTATGRADELGRFVLPLPPERVLVSVRCRFPDGTTVETARVRF